MDTITSSSRERPPIVHYNYLQDRSVHVHGFCGNVAVGDGMTGDLVTSFSSFNLQARQDATCKELSEWTRGMVETDGLKQVLEKVHQGKNWVTITGCPGEGKTTVAKMAMVDLLVSGRQVFHVRSPGDFAQVVANAQNPVILLDDVLGDTEFHVEKWRMWEDSFHQLWDIKEHWSHEDGGDDRRGDEPRMVVLLVSRDYVLKSASVHMGRLYDTITRGANVVDLSADGRRLKEKRSIWDAIVGRSKIIVPASDVRYILRLTTGHGFPNVCRLFVTIRQEKPTLSAETFFKTPLKFLNDTIASFLKNETKLTIFQELLKGRGSVSERELEFVGRTSKLRLKQQAKTLLGTYLRMHNGYFSFIDHSIHESVSLCMCSVDKIFVIQNCSLAFIHGRLRLESDSTEKKYDTQRMSTVSQVYVDDLAERFASEIENKELFLCLSHQACTEESFIPKLMSKFSKPLDEVMKLSDNTTGESFLFLAASSKSPYLLKYLMKHRDIELNEEDILTILHGICKYAATDVFKHINHDPLVQNVFDIDNRFGVDQQTPLMMAIESGNPQFLEDILSLSPNLHICDREGKTAVHYLCIHGQLAALKKVVHDGCDIDVLDKLGCSPLYHACWCNQTDIVRFLFDRGVEVDEKSVTVARRTSNEELVRLFLDRVGTETTRSLHLPAMPSACYGNMKSLHRTSISAVDYGVMKTINRNAMSTLHGEARPKGFVRATRQDALAGVCEENRPQVANFLIQKGANTETRDKMGYTPLHKAVLNKAVECVRVLLKAGANIEARGKNGCKPLHKAAEGGSVECVDLLLKAEADADAECNKGNRSVHYAAEYGSRECLEILLAVTEDVDVKNCDGSTPLHKACSRGSHECIEILLQRKAYVDQINNRGYSPLLEAAESGSVESLQLLLAVEADVNVVCLAGETALYKAAYWGSERCVEFLLKSGMDINSKTKDGDTALGIAASRGSRGCMGVLLEGDADVTLRSRDGDTALHKAAWRGSQGCVEMLLKAGIDANIQNMDGQTALHRAVYYQDKLGLQLPSVQTCKILLDNGADVNIADKNGNTPLHLLCRVNYNTNIDMGCEVLPAVSYKHVFSRLVNDFISNGADVKQGNRAGRSALSGWCKTLHEHDTSDKTETKATFTLGGRNIPV